MRNLVAMAVGEAGECHAVQVFLIGAASARRLS